MYSYAEVDASNCSMISLRLVFRLLLKNKEHASDGTLHRSDAMGLGRLISHNDQLSAFEMETFVTLSKGIEEFVDVNETINVFDLFCQVSAFLAIIC